MSFAKVFHARERHEKRIVSARPRFRSLPTLARQTTQRRGRTLSDRSPRMWGCLSQRSYAGARARRNAGMTFVMVLRACESGAFRKAFARARGRKAGAQGDDFRTNLLREGVGVSKRSQTCARA
jgi:hypothetical protein